MRTPFETGVALRGRLERLAGEKDPPCAANLEMDLLETARVIVLLLDADGRVAYANPFFERLTGFSLGEIEGHVWIELYVPSDHQSVVTTRFARALEGDATVGNVNPVLCKDGGQRVVEWFDRTLRNSAGRAVALLAIGHDVTARVQAECRLEAANAELEAREEARERQLARTTDELRHSREVLEGSFENAPMCLAFLDRDFNFVRVNDLYAGVDGKRPADFAGKNHFDLYPNEENLAIFKRVRDTAEKYTARARSFVYEYNPERGVTHWDWTLTPVKDHDGRVTGLVLALSDVTTRVAALGVAKIHERRAAASEQRLRGVIDTTTALVGVCDLAGVLQEVNRAALEWASLERDLVVGRVAWEVDVWEHDQAAATALRASFARAALGEVVRGDLEVVRPDGTRRILDASYSPLRSPSGEVIAIVTTALDVTEQRRTVEALKVRHEALEASLNALCIASLEGITEYVNAAFVRAWGLAAASDAIGRPIESFWHEPDAANAAFVTVLREGVFEGMLVARTALGAARRMQVGASLVRDERGRPVRAVASFIDVTEAEAIHARVQRQLAEKELLLKEIHHRVKNNLQIISSLLQLQAGQVGDPGLKALLQESQGRIRAMSVVHETLYRTADLGRVDFCAYANRLVGMVRGLFSQPGTAIDLRVDVDGPPLDLDTAIPCGLIVNELVSNAFKHAFCGHTRGTIWVTLRVKEGRCALSVRDDGIGLSFRATQDGLGLRLVHTLADQLGGTAVIDCDAGTEVRLEFAIATERAETNPG